MTEVFDLEGPLRQGTWPENFSSLIADAISRAKRGGEPKAMFHSLLAVGKESVRLLRDLALSEYAHTCGGDAWNHDVTKAVAECANENTFGKDHALLQLCWGALQNQDSILRDLRFTDLGAEIELDRFCSVWEEIRHRGSNVDAPVGEFSNILAQSRPTKRRSIDEFLKWLVNCRNADAHDGEFSAGSNRQTLIWLDCNEDFYQTVVRVLGPAIASYAGRVGPLLGRFAACAVTEVELSSNSAFVKPPQRHSVDLKLGFPSGPFRGEKEVWVVDLAAGKFCFPFTPPRHVRSMGLLPRSADISEPSGIETPTRPGHGPSATTKAANGAAVSPTDSLLEAVASGLFTPVIGPGSWRIQSNLDWGRAHVARRRQLLVDAIADPSEQHYLDSLIASRLGTAGDFPQKLANASPHYPLGSAADFPKKLTHAVSALYPFEEDELVDLQIALVSLGLSLTKRFARAMERGALGITEVTELSVRFQDDDFKELGPLLRNAADSARKLMSAPMVKNDDRALGLGAFKIEQRLRALARTLTEPEQNVSITLLEWVGDLIWHTLRFRAPMYPAPDDLAFQLSVCLEESEVHRKHTVGAVATYFDQKKEVIATKLKQWLETWTDRRANVGSAFHEAVARALIHGMPAPIEGRRNDSDVVPLSGRSRFVPIALDTTFEQEIQRVFRSRGVSFHVVFPAYIAYRLRQNDGTFKNAKDPQECWVIYSEATQRSPKWHVLVNDKHPDSRGKRVKTLAGFDFEGPLIVKLNGAPLVPLPKGPELEAALSGLPDHMRATELRHRVIVSYSDVIRAVGGQEAPPPGLDTLLRIPRPAPSDLQSADEPSALSDEPPPRTLCLMGFSLSDSNNRLRVYDLHYGRAIHGTQPTEGFEVLFVDTPSDPVQHSFLQVRKNLIEKPLDAVAELIDFADGVRPLPPVVGPRDLQ